MCTTSKERTYGIDVLNYLKETYEKEGLSDYYYDFCISYYGDSTSYDQANERFSNAIEGILPSLNREQYIELIRCTNMNNQIYERRLSKNSNNTIMQYAFEKLGRDFDFKQYPNFQFDYEIEEFNENIVKQEPGDFDLYQ